MDIDSIKKEIDQVLSVQDFGSEVPDYKAVEKSIPLIERMSEVENSSIAIFDLFRREFVSIRSKYREQAGVELEMARKYGIAYYISIMHPEDAPVVLDTYKKAFRFTFDLPVEQRKDYKTIFSFRIGAEGRYVNIIQQMVTLELTQS